jgi:hypothetical protein
MKNFKRISVLKKEKADKIILESELVNQYKNAISTLFKTVVFEMDYLKNKNSFYYIDLISNFSNYITKQLQSNNELKTLNEINTFNRITIDLLNDIVQFFIAIDNYDFTNIKVVNDIILFKINIDDGFKNLGQFDLKIKDFLTKEDSSIAMKEYCLNVIKESFYFLNNSLYIDIAKCPFNYDYESLIYNIENSIIKESIELRLMTISNSKTGNLKTNPEIEFFAFINNIKEKEAFAKELKNLFILEMGIDFKIMIELLKDQNIFIIREREFKLFYDSIKSYFKRDIGGYSGLNDKYKHSDSDKRVHSKRINNIKTKLEPLIVKYKTK